MRALRLAAGGHGLPAGLADHHRQVRVADAVEVGLRGGDVLLGLGEGGVHHRGGARVGGDAGLLPVPRVGVADGVEQRVGVQRDEVHRLQELGGRRGPERPVVVGGHGLRDGRAHGGEERADLRGRELVERPAHHRLVADAHGLDDVGVRGGERDRARDLGLVERVVAGEHVGAEVHLDVEVVVADHLQRELRHGIRAVEQADQLEVALHQQVQVLQHHRGGDGLGVAVAGAERRVGHGVAGGVVGRQRADGDAARGHRAAAAAGRKRECEGRQQRQAPHEGTLGHDGAPVFRRRRRRRAGSRCRCASRASRRR